MDIFRKMQKEDIQQVLKDQPFGIYSRFLTKFMEWKNEEPEIERPVTASDFGNDIFDTIKIIRNNEECLIIIEKANKERQGALIAHEQAIVCQTIVNYIVANRLNPGRKEMRVLAEGIKKIFPEEDPEYYVKKHHGGMLANKINSRLAATRKMIEDYPRQNAKKRKNNETEIHDQADVVPEASEYSSLLALNDKNSSWSVIEHNWSETFEYRQKLIKQNKSSHLNEVYEEFPILFHANSYLLVSAIS